MRTTIKNMEPERRGTKSQVLVRDFQERSKKCHEYIRTSFSSEHIKHKGLQKALEYYFSYWNDFTHPGLFSIAYEASGGSSNKVTKPQAAMTMMAAAFDLHDDIIDRSKRKHGHQTVFGRFGHDVTLLLGDAFLIKGLMLLNDLAAEMAEEKKDEVFAATKNSLFEIGNAQAFEIDMKGKVDVFPDKYLQILKMKAASVEADMHVAALIAGAAEEEIETLKKYGRIIGILAILREEFVDIFEVEELNRRIRSETLPIPMMFLSKEPKLREKTMKLLRKEKITSGDLNKLLDIVFDVGPVVSLKKKMEKLVDRATSLADRMKNKKSSALLITLARSMLEDL